MMRLLIHAALLALTSGVWLAKAATTPCATPPELKAVDAELGILQTAAYSNVVVYGDKTRLMLTRTSFGAMAESILDDYKSLYVGSGGFLGYHAAGDKDREFCFRGFDPLTKCYHYSIVNGYYQEDDSSPLIRCYGFGNIDSNFQQDNKDTTDSSLGAAMMALTQANFTSPLQGNTFRVLLIQSERKPLYTVGWSPVPFKGDGTDTCNTDPPTLDKVNEILLQRDAYLSVVALESAETDWKKVCDQIPRCSLTTSPALYKTDVKTFKDVLLQSFCKYRDDRRTSTQAPTGNTASGAHTIVSASTLSAILLGFAVL